MFKKPECFLNLRDAESMMLKMMVCILCVSGQGQGILPSDHQISESAFKRLPNSQLWGESGPLLTSTTLLKCLKTCVLRVNCIAFNVDNYGYARKSKDKVNCTMLDIKNSVESFLFTNSSSAIYIDKSYLSLDSNTRILTSVTSSSFVIIETVIIPSGSNEEYCFLYCKLKGDYCQGIQIENSCETDEAMFCKLLDSPLPATAPLEEDCSSDIYIVASSMYQFFLSKHLETTFAGHFTDWHLFV